MSGDGGDEGVGVGDVMDTVNRRFQSAVANHLVDNVECREHYSDDKFSVLVRARRASYLPVLEAIFIHTHSPELCKQRNNIRTLTLFKQKFTHQ